MSSAVNESPHRLQNVHTTCLISLVHVHTPIAIMQVTPNVSCHICQFQTNSSHGTIALRFEFYLHYMFELRLC